MAYTDEKRALEYLHTKGLPKYTENSITDLDAYLEEIKKVRKQGFATDREEYLQGVNAVAALIRSHGPFLAAIWVVGFSSSITEDRMEYIIGRTIAAAGAISQDLAVREQGQP